VYQRILQLSYVDDLLDSAKSAFAKRQGLTLVRFTAQPEPFLTLHTSLKRVNTPSDPALNSP
jgi:hypothetical protein